MPNDTHMMTTGASKLVRDLMTLPGIVGNLGLSIAEAQAVFNADYLKTVVAFMGVIREALGDLPDEAPPGDDPDAKPPPSKAEVLRLLLSEVAPPRYQFTETRLDFRADLTQSTDVAAQVGLSAGTGAVALSVAGAYSSRSDYRAACRVTTTLHAVPSSGNVMQALLTRAGSISDIDLQKVRGVNFDMLESLTEVREYLGEAVSDDKKKKLTDERARRDGK